MYKYDIMLTLSYSLTASKHCLSVYLLSMCSICNLNESIFETALTYVNANEFMSNINVTMFILFAFVEYVNNTMLALLINVNDDVINNTFVDEYSPMFNIVIICKYVLTINTRVLE